MNTTQQRIADFFATHSVAKGIGTTDAPCTWAGVNMILTGELSDKRPECTSEVIHRTTIILQDAMSGDMRNSDRYKALIPRMIGTGNDPELERRRADIMLDWMWETVLPLLQPIADKHGFSNEWQTMCNERTARAAYDAARAARAARAAYAAYAAYAADAADAAAYADFWQKTDPITVIQKMIGVE